MFILKIYDRNGAALDLGDIVRISDGRHFTFYCEVKYLEAEQVITPFHTFSFSSVEKVDKVPDHARPSTETRYKIWYVCHDEADEDKAAANFLQYLMDWRQCEHLLSEKMWRIELFNEKLIGHDHSNQL